MQYIPHNYQAYCIQRVVEDPAVGLFLRPGLGKTVITLTAVNILKYFRWQVSKVLVVAPKTVAEATWSEEAGLDVDIVFIEDSTSASLWCLAAHQNASVRLTRRRMCMS